MDDVGQQKLDELRELIHGDGQIDIAEVEALLAVIGSEIGVDAAPALIGILGGVDEDADDVGFEIIHLIEHLDPAQLPALLLAHAARHGDVQGGGQGQGTSWVDVLHFRLWNADPDLTATLLAVQTLPAGDRAAVRAWATALAQDARNERFAASLAKIAHAAA